MSIESYSYRDRIPEIYSDLLAIDAMLPHFEKLGSRRVAVVCGQNTLHHSDVVHRVEKVLGSLVVGRIDLAQTHAPMVNAERASEIARELEPDTLVSVGGGSAIMMAKAIAHRLATDRPLVDYRRSYDPLTNRHMKPDIALPDVTTKVVSVATTIGYAEFSEGSGNFMSADGTDRISVFGDGRTIPRIIIIDGRALATTPEKVQIGTTIGQLRVAIESVTSNSFTALSEALGLHCIRLLDREFRAGWSGDAHQLLRLKAAGYLAGQGGSSLGGVGLNSALAHRTGALSRVSHGETNAVFLPHTIRFNASACSGQLKAVAEAFGLNVTDSSSEAVAEQVVGRLERIYDDLGVPRRLRDIGVPADKLPLIAEKTMGDENLLTNARPIESKEVLAKILEDAW